MADSKLLNESWFKNNTYLQEKYREAEESRVNHRSSFTQFEHDVYQTFTELAELLIKKHKDYGPGNIGEAPGGAMNGLRVRMHDKLARINNLYEKNAEPENEPFEDAFKDIANYGIIGLMVLRGRWPNK